MITAQPGIGRVPYEVQCENVIDGSRCEGFARSQFYDLGPAGPNAWPTHEFYSPQVTDIHSWFDRWRYTNNQLFLRKLTNG